jgi:hypothetical protein
MAEEARRRAEIARYDTLLHLLLKIVFICWPLKLSDHSHVSVRCNIFCSVQTISLCILCPTYTLGWQLKMSYVLVRNL